MKSRSAVWLAVIVTMVGASVGGLRAAEIAVTSNSVFVAATLDEARKALTTEDDFIKALSDFDRASRMKSETPVTRAQFLEFVKGEVLAWTEADGRKIEQAANTTNRKLSNLKLPLPGRILLVKTTGKEEGNAAYCRGTNIIVLPGWLMSTPLAKQEEYFVHELFHIFSRNNAEVRKQLYELIGFKPCAEIKFPAELEPRRITNPDASRLDYFVEVTRNKQKLSAVPILFATPDRWTKARGGSFFEYLTWRLMAIERTAGEAHALSENGKPVLLDQPDVSGLLEQVGENPGPVLQPEEILAEYFVKFVESHGKLPPGLDAGMQRLLKR